MRAPLSQHLSRSLCLSLCLAGLVACGDKDDDTGDAPREPYDLTCGELTCEGSTEACWLPDCGQEDSTHSCEPLPESCLDAGSGDGCHPNNACEGSPDDGVICEALCG